MKLTILFLLVPVFCVIAGNSYSQNKKLKFEVKDATVEDVITNIEDQSEFYFLYSEKVIDVNRKVSLNIDDQNITSVLNELFAGTNVAYAIKDKIIVLSTPDVIDNVVPAVWQQTTITGVVSDENNMPLPGVTVVIKGTTRGTVTTFDGSYSLPNVENDAILVFSFVGMRTQEIEVGSRTKIDVVMVTETVGLDEVVAIGYGTRRKKDLTSSISTVNEEVMDKIQSASPQFALQGNATGVRVVNTSGDPNAAPQIFVRGVGTWQGTAQPLYVIDGQAITPPDPGNNEDVISGPNRDTPPNLWTLVNPNDIESISVLKDASAAAIYGSRGANGVILITTKKGKKGAPSIEFNTTLGVQNIPTYDLLNTQQYFDIVNEMYANNLNPDITIEKNLYGRGEDDDTKRITYSPQFDPQSPYYISSRETYDWQDQLIRSNAIDQNYDIKVSGASDQTDYYISFGYKNQESVFYGGGMERYTAAINLNTNVNKWVKTGVNYKFAYQETAMDDISDLPGIADVAPWQPLYDPSTPSGYAHVIDPDPANWSDRKIYGQGSNTNYLALSNLERRDFVLQRHIGQGYVEVMPVTGLTLRGSLNLDYASQDRQLLSVYSNNIFSPVGLDPATEAPDAPNAVGGYGSRRNYILNYQSDFTATYDRSFGKNQINVTAVVQDQYHKRNFVDLSGGNLLSIKDRNKIGYSNDLANNSSIFGWDEKYWFGMVGRLSYIYDGKYYLDASFRRDASSGFDKDYRWGNFYSVSGAWRISSESFMADLTWIDDLKLRGGWGEAGNDETVVGTYSYLSAVGESGSYRLGSGNGDPLGTWYPASPIVDFPNPQLTWEVVKTTYAGFDALLLESKLNVTVELFNRKTVGIQQFVNLPLSVGTNNPAFNIGELTNKGADILVGYNDKVGDFTFGISGNISFLKNNVTKLYGGQPLDTDFGRVEEGRSIGHIWGYKVGGIFQTPEEVAKYYASIPDETIGNQDYVAPGDMYFQDYWRESNRG